MELVRLKCSACDLALEGKLELPPLARLDRAEQRFVEAFVRTHGNIKKMEELFSISYPTVKNRLNAIARKLDNASDDRGAVLDRLARGEISVDEALKLLE
jgi:hypothetical protein